MSTLTLIRESTTVLSSQTSWRLSQAQSLSITSSQAQQASMLYKFHNNYQCIKHVIRRHFTPYCNVGEHRRGYRGCTVWVNRQHKIKWFHQWFDTGFFRSHTV